MNEMQRAVREFILASQTPQMAEKPGSWPDEQTKKLCYKLIKQEVVDELLEAIEKDDFVEIIDGAIDSLYVIFFLLNKIGIEDAQPFYDEVQRTNMLKFDGPIDPETGKQLKPEGWQPPRIGEILDLLRKTQHVLHEMKRRGVAVHKPGLAKLETGEYRMYPQLDDEYSYDLYTIDRLYRPFSALWGGHRTHEVIKESIDIGFGDLLLIRELKGLKQELRGLRQEPVSPPEAVFSGRAITARVTHVDRPDLDYTVVSLELITRISGTDQSADVK